MKRIILLLNLLYTLAYTNNPIQVYGTAHMAFDAIAYSSVKPNRDDLSTVLTSHYSTIGMTHSKPFSPTLQGYVTLNTRVTGNKGEYKTEGEHYIGLNSCDYGSLQFGQQDSPALRLLMQIDPMFARTGEYRSLTKGFSRLNSYMHDKPYKDTIAYLSPFWHGLSFDFSIVTDQDSVITDTDKTSNSNEPHAIGLTYNTNDMMIGIAWTNLIANAVTKAASSIRIGGKYTFEAFTLSGLYDYAKDEFKETHKAMMFSTQIQCGSMRYTAQLNHANKIDNTKKDGTIIQLATDYMLDKRSSVYFQLAKNFIEDQAHFQYGLLNYDKDTAVSIGLIYSF